MERFQCGPQRLRERQRVAVRAVVLIQVGTRSQPWVVFLRTNPPGFLEPGSLTTLELIE